MPTRNIKRTYIGGTTSEARKKYFNQDKELTQVITNLATSYGISPALVIDRLAHEGLIDRAIINNNLISTGSFVDVFGPSLFSSNNNSTYNSPYGLLGLDTIYDTYNKGITKTKRPINIRKMTTRNESGEIVNSAETKNLYDTLELFTAELASRRNQVKKQYPNLTDAELDSATAARYNATNRYFKQLMDSGEYKTKYPIDVEGINIPTPNKTDSKYIQDQTHTVNMDRAFRMAPKETFVYKDKSWNPNLFMTDGYIDEPESPIVKHILNNYAVQNFTQPNKVNFIQEKYKCGGRRKAQLGLDIREGGIAIPIAPNMYYMDGRSHDEGGVAIGPNNKNGVEVEGGEVVEMIDSNHPSVGRQFKAGGQKQTMRVFSSVPFLRGASPAELVLGGANPDVVFKAQEEFKDRNRINDDGTIYKTGGIYIKPSKRGTFTAAATKHGMGVQEFASKVLANKEDYSPAMVKKANFARNASRWKKEYGGSMIYTINGNVKNGLSLRPKAQYGKQTIIRNNKEWKYDEKSGAYVPVKDVTKYKTVAGKTYKKEPDSKNYVEVTDNIEKIKVNQPKKQIVNQNENSINKLTPINENKYTSITKPNTGESYFINPLTGEWIRNGVTETSKPSVKGITKVTSKPNQAPRGIENQSTKATVSFKPSTVEQPAVVRRDEYYSSPRVEGPATPVDETYAARQARGAEAVKEALTYPKVTKTNEIDEPLIGKFKPFTLTDAISGLSNMVGSTASYFINRNLINKYPIPTKPIMTPVVKLKTRFDVSGDIADIEESRRIAADAYKRNTSSSATYLSRLQSGLNTAYRQKAEARRYGERMTNQLINADLQNRQNVYARNVAIQNDYYNRLVGTRQAKSQLEMQNLNHLISGLTGGVTNIMSNIDTRANYNRMAQAIQLANPNVDPRLLGIYDYYEGKNTGKKYNKRGQLIN